MNAVICRGIIVHLTCLVMIDPSWGQQPPGPVEVFDKAGIAKTLIWPSGAPLATGANPLDQPGVYVVLPDPSKATGAACIICPGGGYGHLAFDHEGIQVARWLSQRGIAAFVLQYRVAPKYKQPCPLLDLQRAVRWVRSNKDVYHIDPRRTGVWGFSAGGHLASSIGVHFDAGEREAKDPVDRESCRPDFLILAYPVITFEIPFAHRGSRNNLLGTKEPNEKLDAEFSTHKHVRPDSPPTFLFHTSEDAAVPAENSLLFYEALRKQKIPAELHIYEKGKHGVGLASGDPALSKWPERLEAWLLSRGVMK